MPIKIIGALVAIAAIVGGMVYLTKMGKENAELRAEHQWQESRYANLVDRARQVQEALEEQQRLTTMWREQYDKLAERGPVIRERVRTVTERIPEYLPPEVQDQRAEEALWGLAAFVSQELAPMVEEP